MKKSILRTAAVFVMLTFAVSCATEKKTTPIRAGLVNNIIGEVFIVSVDGVKSVPVIGTPVKSGMKISTFGKQSLCEVYFGENAVKIFGDSELEIDTLSIVKETKAQESTFRLWHGRMFVNIKNKLKKDDEFTVKTQAMVAAVRGTEFFVTQDKANSRVACLDGKVEVNNTAKKSSKPILIEEDQEALVAKGKAPKKAGISKDRKKTLEKDSDVKPVTEENKTTIAGLEEGDSGTIESIHKRFEAMKKKGDSASKDTGTDEKGGKRKVNFKFFKSND